MKIINKQLLPVGTFDAPDAAITLQFTADEPTLVLDLTLEQPAPAPEPEPPADVVTASFTASADGLTATVTDQSTSSGGTVTDVLVNWEGTISDELTPGGTASHTYAVAGTYTIILTAKDDHGVIGTAQQSVDVVGVVAPPQGGSGQVRVTGKLADGTTIDVSLDPGERIPLVAGTLNGSVIFHADGKSVCIENCYMGTPAPLAGHFTITRADGVVVFDGDLTIGGGKREVFWLETPAVNPSPDWSAFPPREGGASASMYAQYATSNVGPGGIGLCEKTFGGTGERPDLGGPQWDVAAITNLTPENAEVVLGMGDVSARWSTHWVDFATNEMVDLTGNPYISALSSTFGKKGNPMGPCTGDGSGESLAQATAHATYFCVVAAELYGTDYHREEIGFWAAYYASLWQNPEYRSASGGPLFSGQVRGKGRSLEYLLFATKYGPTKWQPLFKQWITDFLADGVTGCKAQTGLAIDQRFPADYQTGDPRDYPVWGQHLLIASLGRAIDYGYTDAQWLLDYFAPPVLDSVLGDGQSPTVCHEFASGYRRAWKHDDGSLVDNWRESCIAYAGRNPDFSNALALPEDSLGRIKAMFPTHSDYVAGDFGGYPWSPTGYVAFLRMALAALADHATDQARAQAAWAKLLQHYRADHSNDAKYAWVPRAA